MDTTKIEIFINQLDKILEALKHHSEGLTSGEVAIIAALIGVLAALIPQIFIFMLNRNKDKNNLINEIIADERRLSLLLSEYYKELVMHKVHKKYWYRTSEIHNRDAEDSKDSHNRHFLSNQRSFKTMEKIRITMSDYFKIVTKYIILTKKDNIIAQTLQDIRTFTPRKASDFNNIKNYDELFIEAANEETNLNLVYQFYSTCFNKINTQMMENH
jgi:hypothetical protein